MNYRPLGRTGVQVSPLCLGTMNFGGKTEPEPSMQIIDRAIDAGINFFDTANVYNRGRSEEITGQALARNGKRNRIVLATKVFGKADETDPNGRGVSRRHIVQQCDLSLRRLQTDWIDLYQIHKPMSGVAIDETLRALDDLVRAGKVRYLGTTTFPAWRLVEALWASKEYGLNRFVCEQPAYHLLDRRAERELIPMAQAYGFGLIPWSPLASGFLTGKYRGDNRPQNGRLQPDSGRGRQLLDNAAAGAVVDKLDELARARGCTASKMALAWNLNQPGITSPIIGPRTMEQLEDNLGAVEVTLTAEDRAAIDSVSPPGRAIVPYYESDFAAPAYRW